MRSPSMILFCIGIGLLLLGTVLVAVFAPTGLLVLGLPPMFVVGAVLAALGAIALVVGLALGIWLRDAQGRRSLLGIICNGATLAALCVLITVGTIVQAAKAREMESRMEAYQSERSSKRMVEARAAARGYARDLERGHVVLVQSDELATGLMVERIGDILFISVPKAESDKSDPAVNSVMRAAELSRLAALQRFLEADDAESLDALVKASERAGARIYLHGGDGMVAVKDARGDLLARKPAALEQIRAMQRLLE